MLAREKYFGNQVSHLPSSCRPRWLIVHPREFSTKVFVSSLSRYFAFDYKELRATLCVSINLVVIFFKEVRCTDTKISASAPSLFRSLQHISLGSVPSGYPNPTRYPIFLSIPDPTRFSFRNHRVAGNPKHRVLPDISGKPEVSGTTRYFA